MRLTLEQLERRDTPAVSLGGGELLLASGVQVHPFGDWLGDYNTLESGDLTYVGGTGGAGPRVAVLRPDGSRDRPDFFAGPEHERFGVVFVGAGDAGPTPAPAPTFEPVSIGQGYTLYIDPDANVNIDTAAVVRDAATRFFGPVLDVVRVTNVRPDLTPGSYWSFLVDGSGGGWQGPNVVGRATLGSIPAPRNGFEIKLGMGTGSTAGETEAGYLSAVFAHEAGHGFGLFHNPDPRSVMRAVLNGAGVFLPDELAAIRSAALAGIALIQTRLE